MQLPIQSQPVLRNVSTVKLGSKMARVKTSSRWDCYLTTEPGVYLGSVDIWWGHTIEDAQWACENWISACGNNPDWCSAVAA